ncbi:MAG: cell division protein FtsZ [Treponema sp.]|nr:cell division protein FtsZ [Treponema sp.]
MPVDNTIAYPDLSLPARIKVIGVGGGGSNAVNRMIENGLLGVQFIAVNTDAQDLFNKSKAQTKLQIGGKLTSGRGAGGKPEIGENAAKEDQEELIALVRDADMVFVTAGMGGGTGTGAAPVIARLAKEQGALTVGVVTKPFDFEGETKRKLANDGIKKLLGSVDTLVVIPNQQVMKMADRKTTVTKAYHMADDVLRQGVQGITDLIVKTGLINTDFADVKATMEGQGDALMGIGISSGDARAEEAAKQAIDNPLLEDTSIEGATRLLVNISGSEDTLSIIEVGEIMNIVKAKADPSVEIIHGVIFDSELGDNIKVIVIATGFKDSAAAASGKTDSPFSRKTESPVISTEIFDRYRGLGDRGRAGDNYVGIGRSRNSFAEEDYNIPTALRRHNPESDMASEKEA